MERIIGGLNLPLPDATPDKRIYELLKTVDLENLTFADFQGVAKTIYAEQGAEDELRRIVLVNLARLAVKGNWNGLTTSASGGGTNNEIQGGPGETPSTYAVALLEDLTNQGGTGFGNRTITVSSMTDSSGSYMYYRPFVASKTATLSAVINQAINSTAGASIKVAFYDSDSDGNPDTLIGSASIDMSSFAVSKQTSVTAASAGSMDLTKGNVYWVGYGNDGGGTGATGTGFFSYETKVIGQQVNAGAVGTGALEGYTVLIGPFTPPATFSLLAVGQKQALALGGLYS